VRTPSAVAAAAPACSLLNRNTTVTAQQGPEFKPLYRIYDAERGGSFLTADHEGCAAYGFVGDDTPEGYTAQNLEAVDELARCQIYQPHGRAVAAAGARPVYRVTDPRTGFSVLTLDQESCAAQGLAMETIEGYVE
jgi:hypothetical protein